MAFESPTDAGGGVRDTSGRLDLVRFAVIAEAVTVLLVSTNVVLKFLEAAAPRFTTTTLRFFDVNREHNLPTFWNAALFVMLACAAWTVAALARRREHSADGSGSWLFIGFVALFMAADETLLIHERVFIPVAELLAGFGVTTGSYRWVLPGATFALAAAALLFRWSARLPPDVRWTLLAAVVIYGAGAIGAEAASGWIDNNHGIGRIYHSVTAVEEGLEMSGVLVAILAVGRMLRWVPAGSGSALTVRVR